MPEQKYRLLNIFVFLSRPFSKVDIQRALSNFESDRVHTTLLTNRQKDNSDANYGPAFWESAPETENV